MVSDRDDINTFAFQMLLILRKNYSEETKLGLSRLSRIPALVVSMGKNEVMIVDKPVSQAQYWISGKRTGSQSQH